MNARVHPAPRTPTRHDTARRGIARCGTTPQCTAQCRTYHAPKRTALPRKASQHIARLSIAPHGAVPHRRVPRHTTAPHHRSAPPLRTALHCAIKHGSARHDMARNGTARLGMARLDTARHCTTDIDIGFFRTPCPYTNQRTHPNAGHECSGARQWHWRTFDCHGRCRCRGV